MESLRKRLDLELVTNLTRAKKLIARPTKLHCDIITENLVSIKKQKPNIIVDRPITVTVDATPSLRTSSKSIAIETSSTTLAVEHEHDRNFRIFEDRFNL